MRRDPFAAQLASAAQLAHAGQRAEARLLYGEILAEDPEHAQANFEIATLLQNDGRPGEALEYWPRAVKADGNNSFVRFNYAHCLHRLKRLEDAVAQYNQGIELANTRRFRVSPSDLANAYFLLAAVYDDLCANDEQEKCLRRSISLNPSYAPAHHALGFLCRLQGRREEAEAHYREAIAIEPGFAAVHRDLAFLKKHTEVDADIEAMEMLHKSGHMEGEPAAFLAFGLGKAYGDLQQHQKAFGFWREGNRRARQLRPYRVDWDLAYSKSMRKTFTRAYLRAEASDYTTEINPIFIVSMPRAGSSLVEQILACHSAIYGGGERNTLPDLCRHAVARCPDDLGLLKQADWRRLGGEYLAQVTGRMEGEIRVTDKLPANYLHVGMIRMMFPDAKVIHCARDPMDTALSCFKNNFSQGSVPYTYDLKDLGTIYRDYEKCMAYWHKVLPGWVYDIHYEELTADPEPQIRRLLEHLGLPFEEACLSFHRSERVTKDRQHRPGS